MKYILPILFVAGSVLAQVPVQRRIPWFAGHNTAGPDIPTSLGGMSFRLRASDLVKSNTVTSWVDEIHGYTYTNNTGANQPTNSWNLGVFFKSGNVLSNNYGIFSPAYTWASTQQVFIAFQAISPSGFGPIMGNHTAETLLGYLTAPNGFGSYSPQKLWWSSYPVSAVNYVVIGVGGTDPVQFFTNAVSANSVSGQAGATAWDMLGANQTAHSDLYQGYVKEIIFWTNQTPFTFSPYAGSQVSNLFYYASNVPSLMMGPYLP